MNTREIAGEFRLSHWAQILKERRESGLSIKTYCNEYGYHENTYFYWQRKLREAACEHAAASQEERSLVPGGWAMCRTSSPGRKNKTMTIEIGSCKVQVEQDTDPELLGLVCRTLASIC
jgi:putative transposase